MIAGSWAQYGWQRRLVGGGWGSYQPLTISHWTGCEFYHAPESVEV